MAEILSSRFSLSSSFYVRTVTTLSKSLFPLLPIKRPSIILSKPLHFRSVMNGSSPSPQKQTTALQTLYGAALAAPFYSSYPALAADSSIAEPGSKISLESVLIAIDDFFNRYPYFVASVTFIWLVAIPLTQEYLKKFKYVSAIDAFRKLRDEPDSQLLDIRKRRSVNVLASPNLKLLKKRAVQVEYTEGNEEGFVQRALQEFPNPSVTTLCILDSFDGNSLKAAQLLYEKGFKAAYAIKGGIQGKEGWQEIQSTLLPPSLHVYPRKRKGKRSVLFNAEKTDDGDEKAEINEELEGNDRSKNQSTVH